jgi:uncharacterized protein YeaO (DUF488 family)
MLKLKRVYEPPAREDGQRFLVERLWPRGLKKSTLRLDAWLKDVAPSTELRKWFSHDPRKWVEFQKRYWSELKQHTDVRSNRRRCAARDRNTRLCRPRS